MARAAEVVGNLLVEQVAALAEGLEGILVEHLGPRIEVVARRISSVEDVREVGVAVAGLDLRDESALHGQGLVFEGHRIEGRVFADRVDVHVGERRGDQLGGHEALVEEVAATHLVDQVLRDDVSRAVVHGVLAQHLGRKGPVLHDLRGKLHEVALDLRESAVFHVVEEEVQGMPELMEERLGLVEGQQCGGVPGRTGEIADDRDDGRHAPSVPVGLLHVVAAPGPLPLSVAGEEVEIEHPEVRLVGVENFVGQGLGMVDRYLNRLEGNAVEAVGQIEDAALHVFEREIGAQHVLVEGIFLFADLLGVVPPVP